MNTKQALIVRQAKEGGTSSVATYSPCERYRYELTRTWDLQNGRILFVMLNPSTATEFKNDPTVARCESRAKHLGFGSYRVCNIFALRSADPFELYQSDNPIGEENDEAIKRGCDWADTIVCAWGNHGKFLNRGKEVEHLMRMTGKQLTSLGITKIKYPKHPLYIPHLQPLILWT